MKTNINTDNYEAYLLDYLEGNLSPDEAKQLKAFVAAQGLDWDELTEELPHLEAPAVAYQDKESLTHRPLSLSKGRTVPLYVKIASVAAAAGLLLTVGLWPEKSLPEKSLPEKSLPKVEPIAELKPLLLGRFITSEERQTLPPRTVSFVRPKVKTTKQPKAVRTQTELLADLQPVKADQTPISIPTMHTEKPDFDLIAFRMNTDLAFTQYSESDFDDFSDYGGNERNRSLFSKGLLWLTNGRHDNFASLIGSGVHTVKKEVALAATNVALTAYHRADERFEEVKENWQEKRGE